MKSSSKPSLASPHNPALSPSHLGFPVVGIGASAGGLEAIRRFFRHAPDDSGMAFVVVLHLSPITRARLTGSSRRSPACRYARSASRCRSNATMST